MADALSEKLLGPGKATDPIALAYLTHLAGQPVDAIRTTEPQLLSQSSQSLLLLIQSLSKKSHKPIVESAATHSSLRQMLPLLSKRTSELTETVPRLDYEAELFSTGFSKGSENNIISERRKALRLLQNAERLIDVMDIPPLLNSAVKSNPVNYSSSLDLYAHVRRLASLYPSSGLVTSVLNEANSAVRQMAVDLITTLQTPNLKLAAGLRTVGWLKRIVPELVANTQTEESLPAIFLVCRICTLVTTLEALDPLKQLADEERTRNVKASQVWSGGQHTERYLKRFIEVFREHSFGIVSVSKSVDASFSHSSAPSNDPIRPLPSVIASFPLHLIALLMDTLQSYLPIIKDQASRESILTQVLYCAGSLGRLGADFGMFLSAIGMPEWIELVKRHRLLAGRLESVIGDHRSNQYISSK
ncbi:oligomeric golgi complex component [Pochonia chlamydosporia 170]|uniref:Conserved oligomeric Golgi complex subunit 8 n=1 Tax=Pochonia chlamydosporia 170 TaxID=1380566 RepID=A0A179FFM3_METCM|nr:oligomeric golgi complex component [Pochonia chlamydosporia 170]OAQ64148.1 oligomeric golgi complex component [Pochonia chlamydosporia 170]